MAWGARSLSSTQVESAGVEYIRGKAVLADGGQTVCIDNQRKLSPDNILLCTGSRPFRIPGIPFDGVRIFESDSINTLTYLPKSIAITGSGLCGNQNFTARSC